VTPGVALRDRTQDPLRTIRVIVHDTLAEPVGDFSALYSRMGRPSIPPEKLLHAMLLQAFYSICSERLMERQEFDLLFRLFVGIGVDDAAWDHSTFSENRDRLLEGDIAAKLLSAALAQPRAKRLLSTDHFSVDGTLIEACVSMKSASRKRGSPNRRLTAAAATGRRIFTARSDRTTRTPRPLIPRPGSIARGQARRRSSASWGRRSWRTETAFWSTPDRSRWAPTKPTTPKISSMNCGR